MSNINTTPILSHNNINTMSNSYKETAIGIIPIDWEIKRLAEIISFSKGSNLSKTDIVENGDFKCIHYGELFTVYNEIIKNIVSSTNVKSGNLSRYGDILMPASDVTPEGLAKASTILLDNVILGGDINILRPTIKIDYVYLSYIINFQKSQIIKLVTGSTVRHIYSKDLKTIKIVYPKSIIEQQKIAEILSTWDDAITNCKTTINTLKDRNKGLAQQLLKGKKRLSGFDELWKLKKIKDISIEISSKNKEDEDLIVLSCTKHNGLVPSLEYFGRKIYSDNLKTYKIVEKNVFAYATNHIEEGSIGYQSKYEKALISPMYTVFKTDDDINDEFLFRVLKSNTYIQEYQKRMEGSIDRRGGLRWQEFSKIKVNVPSYEEQTAIALALETADQELKSYETKLEALQLQKKGLMQQLLTGKIRVNVK
ncbi:restriction endonuclease subunit S [Flavobacterium sp. HXWNR29]|uniref:restriction endonuclease subunit S n=1 Tax=Flavobacterium odoriferum TaxID=2946604 RepID=UPI0021CB34F5|nr:restriction endonuclease subunit S [Flavobacterium sp. HXWNR29]MCU4190248.1 restriction endonuclease subunit S [Flavobacterium sp. HXWNR29]